MVDAIICVLVNDLLIVLCFLSRQQLNVIVIIVTMVSSTLTATTADSATGAGIMYSIASNTIFRNLIDLLTHLLNLVLS